MQSLLGFLLHRFRQVVQHVACLVHPATLPSRRRIHFRQCRPEAHRAITDGELCRLFQATLFQGQQHFARALLRSGRVDSRMCGPQWPGSAFLPGCLTPMITQTAQLAVIATQTRYRYHPPTGITHSSFTDRVDQFRYSDSHCFFIRPTKLADNPRASGPVIAPINNGTQKQGRYAACQVSGWE